ncbi:MAG: lipopolysaccharide heptosyltransferase II, partial [Lentisphaerae bacterium GWF2_52_8]
SLGDFFQALPIIDYTLVLHGAHRSWSMGEIQALKSLQAGVGLLFNNSLRDVLHFRMAMVPRLYGAAARGRSLLMSGAWKMPKRISRDLNNFHHAAKYLGMASALGAPDWDGSMPEFKVDLEPETCSPELNSALAMPKIMGLAAGAAYGPAKRWPAEYFREIAKRWLECGGSVVALGAGAEREICAEVLSGFPSERALNLAGGTSLRALMALLRRSKFLVANDSGVMHLAAAMGIPGAAVFGSTDPSATSPVSAKWRVFYEKQDCSPCFSRECPAGSYACLRSVTPDAVWDAIETRQS